jgi:galactose-1-phosphate uridylyltransferase
MMDWEQAEKELQTLREMMRQTLASLDNPQQNMEYYMDLARQVSELHDEIEDRLHVGRQASKRHTPFHLLRGRKRDE